ncbi:hypothetical protein THAOC_25820, partial [Thalassiosira oceanica]
MEQLQFYATMVRETTAVGKVGRSNLIEAAKELELLQSQSAGKMSDLQRYAYQLTASREQVCAMSSIEGVPEAVAVQVFEQKRLPEKWVLIYIYRLLSSFILFYFILFYFILLLVCKGVPIS